jgi:hypothetical protein
MKPRAAEIHDGLTHPVIDSATSVAHMHQLIDWYLVWRSQDAKANAGGS